MNKRLGAVLLAVVIMVGLSGCSESWEQLAQNKTKCEQLGGTFSQWRDGLYGGDHSSCDFNSDNQDLHVGPTGKGGHK